ncbi:unnamed protein product [Lactuca saligna]|uniref:SWIM-type domain-containing protein n=1 Tax=Lactuca saligna TaxID=75948 RepID=A0AA36E1T9_LACSI|nr:unnamed protein product [Lactuca saligna]
MVRVCIYKSKGQYWDVNICPSIRLKLNKLKEQQRFWQVVAYGYMQFDVRLGSDGYVIDLNTGQCGCRAWQLTGYNIRPLNCRCIWPEVDYTQPLPPNKRRLPGRLIMKRKKDQVERKAKGTMHMVSRWGMVLRCTICRERGHNRSTCLQRPNDVQSTSGKVDFQLDIEAELEVERVVVFESESDSDFESESESEVEAASDAEVAIEVPEMEANIKVPKADVEANIKVPLVQDNIEEVVQDEAE